MIGIGGKGVLKVLAALIAVSAVIGAADSSPQLAPVDEAPRTPELALLMGDLQRLTHKLALFADDVQLTLKTQPSLPVRIVQR